MYINLCLFHNVLAWLHKIYAWGFICFFSAFRCAYCYFLNPARKTRPQAPRLTEVAGNHKMSPEATGTDADDNQTVLGNNELQM